MKRNNYELKKYGFNYVVTNGVGCPIHGRKEDVLRVMKLHIELNKDNMEEENKKTISAFKYFIKKLEVA